MVEQDIHLTFYKENGRKFSLDNPNKFLYSYKFFTIQVCRKFLQDIHFGVDVSTFVKRKKNLQKFEGILPARFLRGSVLTGIT